MFYSQSLFLKLYKDIYCIHRLQEVFKYYNILFRGYMESVPYLLMSEACLIEILLIKYYSGWV